MRTSIRALVPAFAAALLTLMPSPGLAYTPEVLKVSAIPDENPTELMRICPLETLQAGGAGRAAILFYGVLPQAWPQFLAYTLYRWEVNIRAAAVLGFVGAGGLGQRIHIAISLFLEHQLLTLILAVYLMVTLVDALSAFLRRRVV